MAKLTKKSILKQLGDPRKEKIYIGVWSSNVKFMVEDQEQGLSKTQIRNFRVWMQDVRNEVKRKEEIAHAKRLVRF